jgi:hypothetical protein
MVWQHYESGVFDSQFWIDGRPHEVANYPLRQIARVFLLLDAKFLMVEFTPHYVANGPIR